MTTHPPSRPPTIVDQMSMSFIYKHLALIMEIASEFVEAHESVEIDELLDEKSKVSSLLDMENLVQLQQVNPTHHPIQSTHSISPPPPSHCTPPSIPTRNLTPHRDTNRDLP